MKAISIFVFAALLAAGSPSILPAQTVQYDAPETLDWTRRQANRIDTVLYSAVLSQEPVNLLLQLWWAWQEFDAVAQAGLYCQAARIAAEKGRLECDLLGYQRDQDVNAMIARATEARRQAHRMRLAAEACAPPATPQAAAAESPAFTPRDVLLTDAQIIELDLSDARAAHDMHIVAQKLEHALRVLRDLELLARSLDYCSEVVAAVPACREHFQEARSSDSWEQADPHLSRALEQLAALRQQIAGCR